MSEYENTDSDQRSSEHSYETDGEIECPFRHYLTSESDTSGPTEDYSVTQMPEYTLTKKDRDILKGISSGDALGLYNIYPEEASDWIKESFESIFDSLNVYLRTKSGFAIVNACFKSCFTEYVKPSYVLFDICIISKTQSPVLVTFVAGNRKPKKTLNYSRSLCMLLEERLKGCDKYDFRLMYGVVDISSQANLNLLRELANIEKKASQVTVSSCLVLDVGAFENVVKRFSSALLKKIEPDVDHEYSGAAAKNNEGIGSTKKQKTHICKVFNDSVHGHMEIHPLCVKIIDTPQFQRLRQINQLGAVQYVYPCATHTRFEHSIGMCHLAAEWLRHLKERSFYDGGLTSAEEISVLLAALCRNLGSGPFSRVFEVYMDIPRRNFECEAQSVKMLEFLIEDNDIERVAEEDYGFTKDHFALVKALILGDPKAYKKTGYPKEKNFLFEIVHNRINGVDVDLWDALERDCFHLNITNSFDHRRLMMFSSVLRENSGTTRIAFRDKEIENIYKMYELHYDLHRQAYSHRITHVIELMITDALISQDGSLDITGKDSKIIKSLSGCVEDPAAFAKLTDSVIFGLASSKNQRAEMLMTSIMKRHLYPSFRTDPIKKTEQELRHRMKMKERLVAAELKNYGNKETTFFESPDDIIVHFIKHAYNEDETDPTSRIHYFSKENPTRIITEHRHAEIRLKPDFFQQYVIVATCRDSHASREKRDALRNAIKFWFEKIRSDPGTQKK